MINTLIVLSVFFVFIIYDIVLRVGQVFNRERPVEYSEYILGLSLERIFALIKAYRGFTLEVDDRVGDALPERFVIVANHQSIVDIPVLGFVFMLGLKKRIRFVAKRELGSGVPLVSQALRLQKHCLVTRHGDPGQALKALDRFGRYCRESRACPIIFPEGTRSRDGEVGHFHTGALRHVLAAESIPILVVALEGGHRIYGLQTILKNLNGASYKMRLISVLPAPQTKQDIATVAEESKRLISSVIAEWRPSAPRGSFAPVGIKKGASLL